MNKKTIALSLTLLTLILLTTPLVGSVQARPCKNRCNELYFKLELSGAADTVGGVRTYEPEGTIPPDSEWIHLKDADWIADVATLQIGMPGDAEYEIISIVPSDYDAIIDADVDLVNLKSYVYVKDVISFADGSTIILRVEEIANIVTGETEGKISGYGTGALKKIKICGESSGWIEDPEGENIRHLTREGKIKCWPSTFNVALTTDINQILEADNRIYGPEDNPRKMKIWWKEIMTAYDITIAGQTYSLGSDFEYKGFAVYTVWDPILPATGLLPGGAKTKFVANYKFDFSAVPGGLKGCIRMRAVGINGVMKICSLWGTGDFKHVSIKATNVGAWNHFGFVTGWPF